MSEGQAQVSIPIPIKDGKYMPKHVIRKATMKDAASIIGLLAELGRPEPKQKEIKQSIRVIQKYISDRDKAILVAEIDSKVIGMISLVFLPRLSAGFQL